MSTDNNPTLDEILKNAITRYVNLTKPVSLYHVIDEAKQQILTHSVSRKDIEAAIPEKDMVSNNDPEVNAHAEGYNQAIDDMQTNLANLEQEEK